MKDVFPMRFRSLFSLCVALLVLSSCRQSTRRATAEGDTLVLRYAQLLTVASQGGHSVSATVADPWQHGRTLQTFQTSRPLRRVVVFTTSH